MLSRLGHALPHDFKDTNRRHRLLPSILGPLLPSLYPAMELYAVYAAL